jgi:hypothetical protein
MNGTRQISETKSGDAGWLTPQRFLLLLAAALLAAFPGVALGLHTFFYRDFGALGYPGAIFHRDSLFRGELPLWNPYSHCGTPFLAQMGAWYPPTWICLLLPLPWAENLSMLAHLVWGGLGMYWLTRRWGVGGFAAGFAGMAYVFNGVILSCLLWGNYIAALAWLPWVAGCVMAAWSGGGRWIALAALASAMQVLTATPELTLLSWLLLGALWLSAVFRGETKMLSSAVRTAGIVLLAAGITMVQMLPFFDLLAHSQRDQNYGNSLWAMPGWGWANLLVPLFHCYRSPQGTWFQHGQDFLASYHLGVGVLALGIVGAGLRRARFRVVLAGAILFCWIMALGSDGKLYDWVRVMFPVLGIARFPVKFAILPVFLLPLLAVWAVEDGHSKRTRRGLGVVLVVILLLMGTLVWFARLYPLPFDVWPMTATNTLWRAGLMLVLALGILWQAVLKKGGLRLAVQLAVLAVLPLDALTHSPNIAPTLPAASLAPGMWQASGKPPPPKLGEGRIMISPDAEARLYRSRVASMELDFTGKRLAEWYNLNLLDGIPKVTGAMTLRPAHFDLVEQYLYYTPGAQYGRGLLDFLSVAWFSAPENPVDWSPRTNFLPVITAGQRPVLAGDKQTLKAMTADDFDPRAVVYLPQAAQMFIRVSRPNDCAVTNAHFTCNRVTAEVTAAGPAMVVLSQTFYHLWHAYVDGKPVKLHRANLAFQAIEVPAGAHRIELVYRDDNLRLGAVISLLSLAVCGWVWFCSKPLPGDKTGSEQTKV